MMKRMTRSERLTLLALLTAVVLIIGGIVAAVVLGARDAGSQELADAAQETTSQVTPEPEADPLADAPLNRVVAGAAPQIDDTFGAGPEAFERIRGWEGEIGVWQGGLPQIILGPEGNWFPSGQPGCCDGRYVVEFEGAGKLSVALHDEGGLVDDEAAATSGWMLLDDCHLPYVALADDADTGESAVTYQVHEYQPAG